MSSWKKATKSQKQHRERHQPEHRRALGLLEKKKDYKIRAQDYNAKQATLKELRKKALNKNPDEFYFHMINSKVKDGIHKEKDMEGNYTLDQIKLMNTQDLKYVAYKRNLESKKIEKLHSSLHMIDAANEIPNSHVFFVDDDDKNVKNFDLCKKLNTHPALLNRRTNRPKLDSLRKMKLPDLDEATFNKIEQQKIQSYKELSKRVDREKQLTTVQQVLELRNALKDKKKAKPIKVKPGTKDSAPIFKWKYERNK